MLNLGEFPTLHTSKSRPLTGIVNKNLRWAGNQEESLQDAGFLLEWVQVGNQSSCGHVVSSQGKLVDPISKFSSCDRE